MVSRIHQIFSKQESKDVSIEQLACIEKAVKVACTQLRTVLDSHTIKIKRTPLSEGHLGGGFKLQAASCIPPPPHGSRDLAL
jgi:hypothetical protein